MPDPLTTLGLAKTTSDIIKNALEFARESKNTDLAQKLIDLYRDFVLLAETNQELRKEVQELKDNMQLKAAMFFAAPVYYQSEDATPFCPTCYEKEGKAIHLVDYGTEEFPIRGRRTHWICLSCKSDVWADAAN